MTSFLKRFSVKERIFLYYMIFFAVISLLTIAGNILSGLAFYYNYKWMLTFLVSVGLLTGSIGSGRRQLVHRSGIYLFSFVILPYCWLESAGLTSPSITYSFLLLILINYMTCGPERLFLNLSFILGHLCLIWFYGTHPGYFKAMTPAQQLQDWLVNIPIVFGFSALLLGTFERAYETERKNSLDMNQKLKALSHTDPLTGLFNRNHLNEYWPVISRGHQRAGDELAILMLDIDYFKAYNDAYGHVRGDQCLKTIGRIIREACPRATDFAYRFGGEEFLIMLCHTNADGAGVVAEKIRADIRQAAIPHIASKASGSVTVSMGVCLANGDMTLEEVLRKADQALYQSKENGRDGITFF